MAGCQHPAVTSDGDVVAAAVSDCTTAGMTVTSRLESVSQPHLLVA